MLSIKALTVGLVMGLIIGLAIGYVILPKDVDTTALEQQVTQLKATISDLESQINDFHSELQTKIDQLDELEAKLIVFTNLKTQISALEEEIEELKKLIPSYKKGEWNLIATFEGSSGLNTDYFYVAGVELRINWTWTSSLEDYAAFGIDLYREGQTAATEMFVDLQKEGTTFAHSLVAANYYLEIAAANLDRWRVTVEVFILK